MKKYITALVGLLLSNYSNGQIKIAENGIKNPKAIITKEQAELIFDNVKSFPNNTELAIALIHNDKINFIGIKRDIDTIKMTENHHNAFEIGSISKVFTSSLLSSFVVNNKINLEDNIQDYLNLIVRLMIL